MDRVIKVILLSWFATKLCYPQNLPNTPIGNQGINTLLSDGVKSDKGLPSSVTLEFFNGTQSIFSYKVAVPEPAIVDGPWNSNESHIKFPDLQKYLKRYLEQSPTVRVSLQYGKGTNSTIDLKPEISEKISSEVGREKMEIFLRNMDLGEENKKKFRVFVEKNIINSGNEIVKPTKEIAFRLNNPTDTSRSDYGSFDPIKLDFADKDVQKNHHEKLLKNLLLRKILQDIASRKTRTTKKSSLKIRREMDKQKALKNLSRKMMFGQNNPYYPFPSSPGNYGTFPYGVGNGYKRDPPRPRNLPSPNPNLMLGNLPFQPYPNTMGGYPQPQPNPYPMRRKPESKTYPSPFWRDNMLPGFKMIRRNLGSPTNPFYSMQGKANPFNPMQASPANTFDPMQGRAYAFNPIQGIPANTLNPMQGRTYAFNPIQASPVQPIPPPGPFNPPQTGLSPMLPPMPVGQVNPTQNIPSPINLPDLQPPMPDIIPAPPAAVPPPMIPDVIIPPLIDLPAARPTITDTIVPARVPGPAPPAINRATPEPPLDLNLGIPGRLSIGRTTLAPPDLNLGIPGRPSISRTAPPVLTLNLNVG